MRILWIGLTAVVFTAMFSTAWLIATPQGLHWALDQAVRRLPLQVEFDEVQGTAMGPISLRNLRYRGADGLRVEAGNLIIDWRPQALFDRILHIRRLGLASLTVHQKQSAGEDSPIILPDVIWPLDVIVDEAALTDFKLFDRADDPALVINSALFRGRTEDETLSIEALDVDMSNYAFKVAGHLTPREGYPLELKVRWTAAGLPINSTAHGGTTLSGNLKRLQTRTVLSAPAQVELVADISDPLDHPAWQAKLNMEPFDLEVLDDRWESWSLGGEFKAHGDLHNAAVSGRAHSESSEWGRLGSDFDVHWEPPTLFIKEAKFNQGSAELTVSGKVDMARPLDPSFELSGSWSDLSYPLQKAATWTSPRGRFQTSGNLNSFKVKLDGLLSNTRNNPESNAKGPDQIVVSAAVDDLRDAPKLALTMKLPYLAFENYEVDTLNVDIDIDTTDKKLSRIDISAARLGFDQQSLHDLELHGSGLSNRHDFTLSADYDGNALQTSGAASYREQTWDAVLDRFDVDDVTGTHWKLGESAPKVNASADRAGAQDICWTSDLGNLCVDGAWNANAGWQANLRAESVPIGSLTKLWRPELRLDGSISGMVHLNGDAQGQMTGTADVRSKQGSATLPSETDPVALSYKDIVIESTLRGRVIQTSIRGIFENQGTLGGEIEIVNPFQPEAGRSVQGNLTVKLDSPELLQVLIPDISIEQGQMTLGLEVSGSVDQPSLIAKARINDAVVGIPQTGSRLEALNIVLDSRDESTVLMRADARIGDKPLNATGTLRFSDANNWNADFLVNGDKLALVNLPEIRIVVTPDLELALRAGRLDVNGAVTIDEADVSPELATDIDITLSPDIVIVKTETEPPVSNFGLYANLKLHLGDKIQFDGYGLKAKLTGDLEITQTPDSATRASGEISLQDGVYSIYGRKLNIDSGRLLYAGNAIENPALDVRVMRKVDDVTVTADTSGTLLKPGFTISSDPDMPDTDKLSYLLTGRPSNKIGSGDAGLLLDAARSFLPKGKSQKVSKNIKSTFGLETIALETEQNTEQGNQQTSVVLGKYLTPRIYVSYAAGLANTVNIFRVRYDLSKNWLLQSESSSEESGGDILFKIER